MHPAFRMPTPVSITGRSSSITNSFINAIIPVIAPTDDEVERALSLLGMSDTGPRCSYCGGVYTEWDHLRPLVVKQRPTGFISEIGNLVPACGKCNQSKGNKPWRLWIRSNARLAPARRGVDGLEALVERLEVYEAAWDVRPLNFHDVIGDQAWDEHWRNWERVLEVMRESQRTAVILQSLVAEWHAKHHHVRAEPATAPARARQAVDIGRRGGVDRSSDLIRMIRTVGMNTFVEHFHLFEDRTLTAADLVNALPQDLRLTSRRTKASTGRRIFREGLHLEALGMIAEARNVDPQTATAAAQILQMRKTSRRSQS